jgi:hypothetical protein
MTMVGIGRRIPAAYSRRMTGSLELVGFEGEEDDVGVGQVGVVGGDLLPWMGDQRVGPEPDARRGRLGATMPVRPDSSSQR